MHVAYRHTCIHALNTNESPCVIRARIPWVSFFFLSFFLLAFSHWLILPVYLHSNYLVVFPLLSFVHAGSSFMIDGIQFTFSFMHAYMVRFAHWFIG
ncbi:hypothetical protein P168DRAFT_142589 [Aspergillus campestris IBT 28561]|uniref:Uncharacterized protein n=1 Tax=Aspergillus campestris (strain IBT 28561) TaxID=1392248 RepID=A0A2I1D554_ASPC2|nr:uncharacterized protein P168DRAFT_142589 [Aspergillus campestris IBT 28561]PKY04988.1 hypothetical protein P168DRAFT_142589 [Aspergillus campestris IBT 28561]